MAQKWSKPRIIERIRSLRKNGRKLNSNHAQTKMVPLYQAACIYLGSWRKAIEAAGIKYDDVRVLKHACPKWSQKKVIAEIRKRKCGKLPLNSNHMQLHDKLLHAAAKKYFGTWADAIAAAGLDYSKLCKKAPMRSWTKSGIASEIMRRYKTGLPIGGAAVTIQDHGLYQAAKRHFGKCGWAKARIMAGFPAMDPRPWANWNRQNVAEEIRRLHAEGVELNTASLQGSQLAYILAAGRKVYGAWRKAIRAAGLKYAQIKKMRTPGWWTKARIIRSIKSLEKRGIRLSSKDIQRSHNPLFGAAVSNFGCWSQAVEAAGISYTHHCRVWSTKAWMRRMTPTTYQTTLQKATTHGNKHRNK